MARLARRLLTPKTPLPPRLEVAIGAGVALLLLAAWCAATYGGFFRDDFVPPPHRVFTALWKSLGDGSLLKHTLVSLTVIYSGFLMASLIAVPVGVAMGSFRVVAAAIEPVINFVRYLPVTAMIPLLILWIGIGVEEKIAVIFIGLLSYDVWLALWWDDPSSGGQVFGVGVGTLVLAVNVVLIACYTFGCHSIRHLSGGFKDEVSKSAARMACYNCTSSLNGRHQLFAYCSMASVVFADVYVRCCSMGIFTDVRIF